VFKWLAAAAAVSIVLPFGLVLLAATDPAASQASTGLANGPSVLALNAIPPVYLALYQGAARACPGLPWGVQAGIGEVESDHGQSTAPGVHSGANFAGAQGPMQFEPATFAQYAVDGNHDGTLSPFDPADAIYSAAAMLCANGAACDIRRCVCHHRSAAKPLAGRTRSLRLPSWPPEALSGSVGQGPRKAELWQDAGFEAGDGADLVAGEGQHEQAVRVGDRGVGVA
jgi:hypothetical protein